MPLMLAAAYLHRVLRTAYWNGGPYLIVVAARESLLCLPSLLHLPRSSQVTYLSILTGGQGGSWYCWHGRWWMIQAGSNIGPFTLGFHLDTHCRRTGRDKIRYGPYLDLHLPFTVVSVGVNPAYSGEIEMLASYSRGGVRGATH